MTPRIRPFRPEDVPEIRALVEEVLAEFGLGLDRDDLDDPEASYRAGGGEVWVVEDEAGRLVGTGALWPDPQDPTRAEIRRMYLRPAARGHGLGRRLLRLALDRARTAGRHRVELETTAVMEAARALYRSEGFEEFDGPVSAGACERWMRLVRT